MTAQILCDRDTEFNEPAEVLLDSTGLAVEADQHDHSRGRVHPAHQLEEVREASSTHRD